MMPSKEFIKRLSIALAIVLVVLWFGSNIGLYPSFGMLGMNIRDLLVFFLIVLFIILGEYSRWWMLTDLRKKLGTFYWVLSILAELIIFGFLIYLLTEYRRKLT